MRHGLNDDNEPAGHASGLLPHHASNAVLRRSPMLLRRFLALALTSGVLVAAGGQVALSQVQVGGKPEAVHIEAKDVTLREMLDALQANFNLHYRSDDVLDTRMTGTFNGPLRQVAARILDGYDFAMKISPQDINVLVLRQNRPDGKAVVVSTLARTLPGKPPAKAMTAAEANRGLAR
jgi:hypothetical protein